MQLRRAARLLLTSVWLVCFASSTPATTSSSLARRGLLSDSQSHHVPSAYASRPTDIDALGAGWQRQRTYCHADTPLLWLGRHCWPFDTGGRTWADQCLDLVTGRLRHYFGHCPRRWVCEDGALDDRVDDDDEVDDWTENGVQADPKSGQAATVTAEVANAVCRPAKRAKKRRFRGWRRHSGVRSVGTSRSAAKATPESPSEGEQPGEHRPLLGASHTHSHDRS